MNSKPTLFFMIGIPASGKSFKTVQLAIQYNSIIHSSDNIREELSGDVNNQDINQKVFSILHSRVFADLYAGNNVIYDATNVNQKNRLAFLNQLNDKKIDCNKIAVVMATPYEDCLANNRNRERVVPEEVITRMYKNFVMPSKFEGFNEIQICYNREIYPEYDFYKKIEYLKSIPHDNPHHSLSIGNHCVECREQMVMLLVNKHMASGIRTSALLVASLLHDIGKEFTKEFKNSKGEPTKIAHYYQHHCVGAYDSMFYLKDGFNFEEYIRIILLINHHMKPFEWEHNQNPDKAIAKFKKIYGEEFYEDITLLHECDLNAH